MSIFLNILKAIPGIIGLIKGLKDVWDKWEMSKIKKHYEAKQRVRHKLLQQLKEAESDEETKRILEVLAMLDSTNQPDEL